MIKLTDPKIRKKHYLFLRICETNKRLKRSCTELDALIKTKGENKKADQKLIKRQKIVNKFREQLFNEFKLFMRDKNAIPMPPEEIMYAVNREMNYFLISHMTPKELMNAAHQIKNPFMLLYLTPKELMNAVNHERIKK